MPYIEKSISSDSQSALSRETGGDNVIFGTFFSTPSGMQNTALRSFKTKICLKDREGLDYTLDVIPSGFYQSSASANLANIFFPFKSQKSSTIMPGFNSTVNVAVQRTSNGTISVKELLPYFWNSTETTTIYDRCISPSGDGLSSIISSEKYYHDLERYRDVSDIRTFGFRFPLVGIGWGFDTNGAPFPSGTTNKFKGNLNDGYQMDPQDYIAAPVDMRYDRSRDVWISATNALLPCSVTQDGGASGTQSTACTLTYTVKDLSGNTFIKSYYNTTLATGMSPVWARPPLGRMNKATHGKYYRDSTNTLILYEVDETFNTAARSCPSGL